jgi:hypothetical protein
MKAWHKTRCKGIQPYTARDELTRHKIAYIGGVQMLSAPQPSSRSRRTTRFSRVSHIKLHTLRKAERRGGVPNRTYTRSEEHDQDSDSRMHKPERKHDI